MLRFLAVAAIALPPTLAATHGGSLFSSYVSLSIELIGFPDFAGSKDSPNEFTNNLVDNLVKASGDSFVVRVGGNSADRAIFDSTLTTPTASACPNADPGAWQCIGPSFFDSYGGFPNGTIYSHGFNLATWNSSGFATLQSTVPLACNALRGQLNVFEIGNEPDVYAGSRRPSNYSVDDYVSQWLNESSRFVDYLQEACPDMVSEVHYMFPSLTSPGAKLHVPDILAAAGDGVSNVSQISVHNYMGGATSPGVTLQSTLMNHTAIKNSIGSHVAYANSINDPSADYIIGEHNSLYGGGAAGLSNVFGAALWGMDFALYAASTKIIKRLHYHQSIGAPYSAWNPVSPYATYPPYYGKLAASTFLADSDSISVETISLDGDEDVDSGYYAYDSHDHLQRIALLNLREYDPSSQSQRGSQKYTVKVPKGSKWQVQRLTAPAATSQTNVTFNGYSYDASSMGKPALVDPSGCRVTVKERGGHVVVAVADSEAVVLLKH